MSNRFKFLFISLLIGSWMMLTSGNRFSSKPTSMILKLTSNATGLSRISSGPGSEEDPKISPDGKMLLFNGYKIATDPYITKCIELKKIGETSVKILTEDNSVNPSWTPDGTGFIYIDYKSHSARLAKKGIDGKNFKYLLPDSLGVALYDPSFNHKADKIVFTAWLKDNDPHLETNEDAFICLLDSSGNEFRRVIKGRTASWHPTKDIFTFQYTDSYAKKICICDMEQESIYAITTDSLASYNPSFSPDGNHITFSASANGNVSHIFMMNADGTGLAQLTNGSSSDYSPNWSADGYIYFSSTANAIGKPDENQSRWRLKPILQK